MQARPLWLMFIIALFSTACLPWSTTEAFPEDNNSQDVSVPTVAMDNEIETTSPVSPLAQPISPVATPLVTEEAATPPILTPVKMLQQEEVFFKALDSSQLQGTLFGQGQIGVIIIHASDESEQSWADQAKIIAAQGFIVLTYSLREQNNLEEVTRTDKNLEDLRSAIDFLKARGISEHILMGSKDNGILAIKVAAETGAKAVVVFSTPLSTTGSLTLTAADLQAISAPKLFIDTVSSPTQPAAVQMFEWSNSPKTWRFLPGDEQGAEMYGEEYSQNLMDFVAAFFLLRLK